MLENINDYISLIVMVIVVIMAIRLLIGACIYKDEDDFKNSRSIIFNYSDNEDE